MDQTLVYPTRSCFQKEYNILASNHEDKEIQQKTDRENSIYIAHVILNFITMDFLIPKIKESLILEKSSLHLIFIHILTSQIIVIHSWWSTYFLFINQGNDYWLTSHDNNGLTFVFVYACVIKQFIEE